MQGERWVGAIRPRLDGASAMKMSEGSQCSPSSRFGGNSAMTDKQGLKIFSFFFWWFFLWRQRV